MTCSCVWKWQHGVQTLLHREPTCEQHGDGSLWWRRYQQRVARSAVRRKS